MRRPSSLKSLIIKIHPDTGKKTDVLPVSLRTNAGERYYAWAKTQGKAKKLIEDDRLKVWRHWALINNPFPYDMAFKVHHLLIPLREVTEENLNHHEKQELESILDELSDLYDTYLVNFKRKQSIRHHYHVHLLTYKDSRSDLGF